MINDTAAKQLWIRETVLYHIYPRSFQDSNGDGIGDLQGIIDRLDYLNDSSNESLGVKAIWLSPIFRSPMVDFGYDIVDYELIDPVFGDMATFDRLVTEAHKRGIKVLLDFVPNHTSTQHDWFKESRQDYNNYKRDWYIWKPPKPDGSPPNNWLSVFGGSAWQLDEATGEYYLHSFLPEQADLNWRNLEVKKHMLNVLRFWLKRGVSGFRTDAIYNLIKDAKLRDDPPNPAYRPGQDDPYDALLHTHSSGQDELSGTLANFCEILGENSDAYLVSEAYVDIPEMIKLYHACPDHQIHSPFNFNLIGREWSAPSYRDFIDRFEGALDPNDWPNYVLGNHDRSRLVSRLGSNRAKLLGMMQLTLRGMPVIYYGEEIGMQDESIPENQQLDPWGRRVPGFGLGRDPERTPMKWDASKKAGFTTGVPWLSISSNHATCNVEAEKDDPNSFLNMYRTLIHYRQRSPGLLTGRYESQNCGNEAIFTYKRICSDEILQIALNFSNQPQTFEAEDGTLICSTHADARAPDDNKIFLRAYEGQVIQIYTAKVSKILGKK